MLVIHSGGQTDLISVTDNLNSLCQSDQENSLVRPHSGLQTGRGLGYIQYSICPCRTPTALCSYVILSAAHVEKQEGYPDDCLALG